MMTHCDLSTYLVGGELPDAGSRAIGFLKRIPYAAVDFLGEFKLRFAQRESLLLAHVSDPLVLNPRLALDGGFGSVQGAFERSHIIGQLPKMLEFVIFHTFDLLLFRYFMKPGILVGHIDCPAADRDDGQDIRAQ